MDKLKLIAFLSILFLIVLIPQSFAMDNETALNSTDIYFDVNAPVDGDGSMDSPYNSFTDERIRDNSTIHLAAGEYFFEDTKSFENISFYGSSPQETVLNGNEQLFITHNISNFRNITLTNIKLISFGSLNATGTHFTRMISSYYFDMGNDYGGAVSAFENMNLYFDNCTFYNNTAQYGGAIYANGGNLTIINSLFYNNLAYEFGGAVLADKTRVIINNTRFIANRAAGDAGGAIYLISSTLTSYGMTVSDSSATFGGAITALRSALNLTGATFENNTAKYDGGAIYQFYGSLNMTSSRFISNAAKNGAGIFTDDVNVTGASSNQFINNTALNCGGAVYSLLKYNYTFLDNLFEDNTAFVFADVFTTSQVNLNIGDGNYTMYVLNGTSNSTIPSSYDLRKLGLLTPVKNQLEGGNCWAFAALAALESCVLKASGEVLDLSEENMKNLMAMFSDYGRNERYPNDGGTNELPIAYLASWLGPVNESDDAYDDVSQLSPVLRSFLHVQNVIYLKRNNYEDNDAIKRALMDYGAVATTLYFDSRYIAWISDTELGYYFNGNPQTTPANHAVAIVGWDDSIIIRNDLQPGAWIVKNSWGPEWGYDGYFYVSYYDTVFARPGTYSSYTFILNDTQHFDKSYQYDISGVTDYFYVPQNTIWYENAFNVTDDEFLAGVSTYFEKDTYWELYIYINSRLQLVQTGSSAPGYYTINLNYPVPMAKGDVLEILFRIAVNGDVGFPISEASALTKTTYGPMQSFVSLDGVRFYQLHNLTHVYPYHTYSSQVACIKGFTQFMTLNITERNFSISYDSLDLFSITVDLADEKGNPVRNGNVTFTINGENHTSAVYNGIASIKIPLALGLNSISWSFASPNYISLRGNATYEVLPVRVEMNITVTMDLNDVYVNFTLSQPLDENFTVSINGVNQTVKSVNGTFHINLTNLDYGQYDIIAIVDDEFYDCANSTGFFVDVKRTCVNLSDMETFYGSGEFCIAVLSDEFGEPLRGVSVRYVLDGGEHFNVTDDEGRMFVPLNRDAGNFTLDVFFEGDDSHLKSQNTSKIRIDPSRTSLNISSVVYDSFDYFNITVNVYDQLNRTVDFGEISLKVNDVDYIAHDGVLRVRLVLGKNNISALFKSKNYLESFQNLTYDVSPVTLHMNITATVDFNNVTVRFSFSQKINESITVNMAEGHIDVENGIAYLNLTDLDYGQYEITASVDNEFYDCSNSTGFFIDVKRTCVSVSDIETFYGSGKFCIAVLSDEFGEPLRGVSVRYVLDGGEHFNVTDDEGRMFVPLNLDAGKFTLDVFFEGDELHVKSQNSSKIMINQSKTTLKISSIDYDSLDYFNITVNVYDQLNRPINDLGIVVKVNGAEYMVYGGALRTRLVLGKNNISAIFTSQNYLESSFNQSFEVTPIRLEMEIGAVTDFNNASVELRVSQPLNENVTLSINGENQTVTLINGRYVINLTGLEYGEYSISAEVDNGIYDCRNSTSFFVNVKRTFIKADDFETVCNSAALYSIQLLDQFSHPVNGREITFVIGDDVYHNVTDENGTAKIPIGLASSVYHITVSFKGDGEYFKSQNNSLISVKSSINLPLATTYALNCDYEVYLLGRDGNPLKNASVTLTVNGRNYELLTDANGMAVFAIPFTSGNFNINVINPATGEISSQEITVVKRITQNSDMSFYYGNYPVYKVRVCADNGQYKSGLEVKFTLNKKVYYIKTDASGYASLKVSLAVGKYTVTAEYKGFKVSNKITVKTTLITKNKKVKKGKTVKFKAKLLNRNGKAMKGKKIKFKVKGKTYKAKTNKKGIATVKIRNLKVGKHKITSSYGKLKSTSLITVKK